VFARLSLLLRGVLVDLLHKEETQGQRGGPAQDGELQAVPNRLPRRSPLWRLDPHDLPLGRERPLGGVQGDLQNRFRRNGLGEVEQHPPATHVAGPSLDRHAFAATLSVDQARILAVVDAANGLQDDMQRAAATAGRDSTAAEAIARLVGR